VTEEERELNTLLDKIIRIAQVAKAEVDVRTKKRLLAQICGHTSRFVIE